MQITKVNYALVVYLALIEGLSLLVLDLSQKYPVDAILGLFVGFIPALVVLSLYRFVSSQLPIKLNGTEITKLPIVSLSVANALFIQVLFFIQRLIPGPSNVLGEAVFGLLSVICAGVVLILIYNVANLKIKLEINDKLLNLKHMDLLTAVYAGIFEFFILPMMFLFYSLSIPGLINGLVSGLVGSLIGLWIVNKILEKRSLELLF